MSCKENSRHENKEKNEEWIIIFTQEKYLQKVIDTFRIQHCKLVLTLLAAHFKLSNLQCPKTDKERAEMTCFLMPML